MEKYEALKMEVVRFEAEDIVTASQQDDITPAATDK